MATSQSPRSCTRKAKSCLASGTFSWNDTYLLRIGTFGSSTLQILQERENKKYEVALTIADHGGGEMEIPDQVSIQMVYTNGDLPIAMFHLEVTVSKVFEDTYDDYERSIFILHNCKKELKKGEKGEWICDKLVDWTDGDDEEGELKVKIEKVRSHTTTTYRHVGPRSAMTPKNKLKFKTFVQVFIGIDDPQPQLTPALHSLEQTLQDLCLNEDLCDVKLKCGDQEFPCHKFILSLRSDVFKAMFSSDIEVKDDNIVEIMDVDPEVMTIMLKFLYTDKIEEKNINCQLLIAADKYNIKKLIDICLGHLVGIIDKENIFEITFTAYLIDNDGLLEYASKFIFENHEIMDETERWDEFKATHPKIGNKIMDLMVFNRRQM